MYCWHCGRPITIPKVVNSILKDTSEINSHVRMSEQSVKCSSCGASYIVEVYSNGKPTVSDKMLMLLDNRIHP